MCHPVITHEDHKLVTSGPYRWIRNPLGLVTASWIFIAGAATMLLFVWWGLPRKETELEARFGQEYRDYVCHTGRLLPWWSS